MAQIYRGFAFFLAFSFAFAHPRLLIAQDGMHPKGGYERVERRDTEDQRRTEETDERRTTKADEIARDRDLNVRSNETFKDAEGLKADLARERKEQLIIDEKIRGQIEKRGWDEQGLRDIYATEPSGQTIDNTKGRDDPATVYGEPGKYMVVNDRTREVIQISDKNDPHWEDDSRIHWFSDK
jgi:hypothetical protein